MDARTVRGWSTQFEQLADRVGPCFGRHDLRSQAQGYLRGQPFVVAVSGQQRLWVNMTHQRMDQIVKSIPLKCWFRMSIADGAKGPRG